MYRTTQQIIDDRTHKFTISRNEIPVNFGEALELWQHDAAFRTCFIALLTDSPFTAYRWETPPITKDRVDRLFEFVLLNSPGLARPADQNTYAPHFANADQNGIAVFDNLGKDAILVVPAPLTLESAFAHLAAFIRSGSDSQKHALWEMVGQTVQRTLSARPLWLSTAGGGVAWLHVRLDSHPKYYRYLPYRSLG